MGSPYRMPSAADFQELIDNCTHQTITLSGVFGLLLTSNINGKTIFLPAVGYYEDTSLKGRGSLGRYWSSTYVNSSTCRDLGFDASSVSPSSSNYRQRGFVIRPVFDPNL